MSFKSHCLVPGLPHVLSTDKNPAYAKLASAAEALGDRLAAAGVQRLLYYSTGWISVLGQSFQARADLHGLHVDENWYAYGDLPFSFRVDAAAARRMAAEAAADGYQTKLIDYDGFPVDTGTIVADRLLNRDKRFSATMVSCCVYSDYADTVKLLGAVSRAVAADGVPTAAIAVSMLSGRFFTTDIDLREDHIAHPDDDRWNQRLLAALASGDAAEAKRLLPDYAKATKADMGMKALAFLEGTGGLSQGRKATVHAYGALYGTGAAVVEL